MFRPDEKIVCALLVVVKDDDSFVVVVKDDDSFVVVFVGLGDERSTGCGRSCHMVRDGEIKQPFISPT